MKPSIGHNGRLTKTRFRLGSRAWRWRPMIEPRPPVLARPVRPPPKRRHARVSRRSPDARVRGRRRAGARAGVAARATGRSRRASTGPKAARRAAALHARRRRLARAVPRGVPRRSAGRAGDPAAEGHAAAPRGHGDARAPQGALRPADPGERAHGGSSGGSWPSSPRSTTGCGCRRRARRSHASPRPSSPATDWRRARRPTLVRLSREFDLERLRGSADAAAVRIARERRLGPWSAGVICALRARPLRPRARRRPRARSSSARASRARRRPPRTRAELLAPYGEWAGLASVYLLARVRSRRGR